MKGYEPEQDIRPTEKKKEKGLLRRSYTKDEGAGYPTLTLKATARDRLKRFDDKLKSVFKKKKGFMI